MATILDLVIKHNALTQGEILIIQQFTGNTFIEQLLESVGDYPKLYTVFEEYYQNNLKEINNIGTYDRTPLMCAISSKAMVKFLLSCGNGANINYQDYNGYTALHLAVYSKDLGSVKLLCKYGVNMHIKNHWNRTPIDEAIIYNGDSFVRLLLEYDSNTTEIKYKDLVNNISLLNAKN